MNSTLSSNAHANHHAVIVSPRQAAAGTFLGGPVACIYYVRRNYLAIGDLEAARNVLKFGALLLIAWNVVVALDVLVPKPASIAFDFLLKVTPLLLVIFARLCVQKQLGSLPRQYDFYSNWGVVGSGMLCLVASIACLLPAVVIVVAAAFLA